MKVGQNKVLLYIPCLDRTLSSRLRWMVSVNNPRDNGCLFELNISESKEPCFGKNLSSAKLCVGMPLLREESPILAANDWNGSIPCDR